MVVVDGRQHVVDAAWDTVMSGSGNIAVDGVEVQRWGWGMKMPGMSKSFALGARQASLRQGCLNFELIVEGASQQTLTQGRPWAARAGSYLVWFCSPCCSRRSSSVGSCSGKW